MASVLHCLVNCKQLERAFLDLAHPYQSCELLRKGNKRGCLSCAFDKVVLEYFGSANGIDAIAALEETEADSSSLASSRFVFHEAEMNIQTQERQRCGHPIILSSFLAETWKQVGMKQFAGQHQHDAQEFFNSFVHSLATSEAAYHDTCTKLKQMSCPTLIRKSTDEKKVEKHTKGKVLIST
jgi:ubiquitin C-terminal hydrolase